MTTRGDSSRPPSTETSADDVLMKALRELPAHAVTSAPGRRIEAEARAAFLRAFDDAPWYAKLFGNAGRAAVPVVLASVVGLYLFWAFAAAIAVNQ